jgi:hypothetical protein
MRKVWEVISRYQDDLANFGNHNPNWERAELFDMEELRTSAKSRIIHAVFTDREKLKACLKELKDQELGISTVVSGLCAETEQICAEIGLRPHTVNTSLGIQGRTDLLPRQEVLEIHTLCGHAMVGANLIEEMVRRIETGKITCQAAAKKLSRMCDCGIFNTRRAEKLLAAMTEDRAGQ